MRTFALSSYSRFRTELMGIAIIGVSLLHAIAWAEVDGTLVGKFLEPFARIAFTEGFLFLSGFGLVYSFSKDGNCKRFYLKRIKRLWLPFILMALPFYLYGLCSGNFTLPRVLAKFTTAYFWIWGNDGMWYISMSVALYLLFPAAYRYMFNGKDEKSVLCNTMHIVILCYVVLGVLYYFCADYYNLLQIGITKAPIFFIGMLIAYLAKRNKCLSIRWLAGGGISLVIIYFLKHWSPFWIPTYEMAFRLLAMPIACIAMMKINSKCLEKVLQWFGKYSLEIYVLQMLMIGTAGSVLLAFGVSDCQLPILKTCLCFAIVFAVASPVHKVTARL